jgi:hypothetical protein
MGANNLGNSRRFNGVGLGLSPYLPIGTRVGLVVKVELHQGIIPCTAVSSPLRYSVSYVVPCVLFLPRKENFDKGSLLQIKINGTPNPQSVTSFIEHRHVCQPLMHFWGA